MLEYDNSAFYYFALTLLAIYIIPGTWFAVSEFVLAFVSSGEVGAKARTKSEAQKAATLKKKTTGFARLNTTAYLTNLAFLIVSWVCFLFLMNLVINDGEVSTFDPYTILGIAQGAGVAEIKKAYRKLSLKYHPDKNIGDKVAEEMFMRIAKAYEALTDETSKENYEKFGNPDGKQALEVSIGLPKIILENPKVVLVLYLIAMVVVIPSAVGLWYSNSKQFGEKNIKYETYNAFYTLLQESFRTKNLPEVVAASAECREINTPKPTDNEPMGVLYGKLKNDKLMVKPKYEHPSVLRGNLLLHAHLLRMTSGLNSVSALHVRNRTTKVSLLIATDVAHLPLRCLLLTWRPCWAAPWSWWKASWRSPSSASGST
jgi:translocation protein SEC63